MDKYERIRVLGQGSYGKAWLVRDKTTRELYVMKVMKAENKKELEEMNAEASLHATLEHKHVIKYHEVIRAGSRTVHIVMEFAPGGDLQARINRNKLMNKPFPEEEVLSLMAQTCLALNYLHSRGMIHRDVKAANVFLTEDGHVKLGDFGIARIMEQNAARLSARTCNTPVGTPMYMAPELAAGKAYGQSADVWALGCLLYELLTLRPAFSAQSMDGLMSRIRRGRYDRNIPEMYSQELQELVHEMIHVSPKQRPSVQSLLERDIFKPYLPAEDGLSPPRPINPLKPVARDPMKLSDLAEEDADSGEARAADPRDAAAVDRLKRPQQQQQRRNEGRFADASPARSETGNGPDPNRLQVPSAAPHYRPPLARPQQKRYQLPDPYYIEDQQQLQPQHQQQSNQPVPLSSQQGAHNPSSTKGAVLGHLPNLGAIDAHRGNGLPPPAAPGRPRASPGNPPAPQHPHQAQQAQQQQYQQQHAREVVAVAGPRQPLPPPRVPPGRAGKTEQNLLELASYYQQAKGGLAPLARQ